MKSVSNILQIFEKIFEIIQENTQNVQNWLLYISMQ